MRPRLLRVRAAALLAATALFAVSAQASVVEACGLCPVDCPMHADHPAAERHAGDLPAAAAAAEHGTVMRCHGAAPAPAGGEATFRRPPCRTYLTLSASLLPPFVLAAAPEAGVVLPSSTAPPADARPLRGRDRAPETPPPIPLV